MKRLKKKIKGKRHGGVLISALVFTVVISMLLAGIGTLSVSHYARAKADLDYANALGLAEAGANYEFNKISKTPLLADRVGSGNGVTYPLGTGTFAVYVTKRDNSVWSPGSTLYVYSKGTVNGISRTIQVSGKVQGNSFADYAMFADDMVINQGTTVVGGDIGTNSFITLNNAPTINGFIDFNGPTAT